MIHGYTYYRKNWPQVIMAKLEIGEIIYKRFNIDKMFFGSCVDNDPNMNAKIFHYLCTKKPFLFIAKNDLRSKTTADELKAIFPYVNSGYTLYLVSDICHIGRCTTIAYTIAKNQNKQIRIIACPSDVPYLTGPEDVLARVPDNFLFNVSLNGGPKA